jgi:hypothetical protein
MTLPITQAIPAARAGDEATRIHGESLVTQD